MKEEETLISRLMEIDLCLLHFRDSVDFSREESSLNLFVPLEALK